MKTILTFESGEDCSHDREKLRRIMAVDDLCSVLWNLTTDRDTPVEVRRYVSERLSENNINLEEIYS